MRDEKQLHELRGGCYSAMTALTKKAADEKRAMSEEENQQWEKAYKEMQSYDAEIQKLRVQAEIDAELNTRESEFTFARDEKKAQTEMQRYFERLFSEDAPRMTHSEAMKRANSPTRAQNSTATDAQGQYMVPQEFISMLEVYLKAYGGMLQASFVHNSTRGGTLRLPIVDDTPSTGGWQAKERSSGLTANAFTSGEVTLTDHMWADMVTLTWELIQDEDVNFVASRLAELFGARAGRALNYSYTRGDGSGEPTGILAASGGAATGKTTASGTAITKSEIIDLVHSVDPAYRPGAKFMLNDATLAYILKLDQTTNVAPIWQPSFQDGIPGRILGYEYVVNQDFPTIATGEKTIAFGNWSKYYIRNVKGFSIIRLKERFADQLMDGFLGWLRTDGKLVNTSAIKLLVQA
jgi:HK97 family phage major capsid protein